jgi:hypothetical protein
MSSIMRLSGYAASRFKVGFPCLPGYAAATAVLLRLPPMAARIAHHSSAYRSVKFCPAVPLPHPLLSFPRSGFVEEAPAHTAYPTHYHYLNSRSGFLEKDSGPHPRNKNTPFIVFYYSRITGGFFCVLLFFICVLYRNSILLSLVMRLNLL